jgi:hypothetical protein
MDGDTLIQFDLEQADGVLEGRREIAGKGRSDPFARPSWLDGEISDATAEPMQFASRLAPNAVRFRVKLSQQLLQGNRLKFCVTSWPESESIAIL